MSKKSWYSITAKADAPVEINIYDEIGFWGISAKQFLADLAPAKGRDITLHINSPGGDVFEGMAIYNRLRSHDGVVNVIIDGLAASMASVIAMAGTKVSMAEGAMLMIHNPSAIAIGESKDMRKTADQLDQVRDGILTAYSRKTGKSAEELTALLDAETWMLATEAKASGFVDEITDGLKAVALARPFDMTKFRKAPAAIHQIQNEMKFTATTIAAISALLGKPLTAESDHAEIESGITALLEGITTDRANITALTAERDGLKTQFDALVTSVDGIKAELLAANGKVGTLTAEHATITARAEVLAGHKARLEKLCGVHGVNPDSAPPRIDEPAEQLTEAQWTAKYSAASPKDKPVVWAQFSAAAKAGQVKQA